MRGRVAAPAPKVVMASGNTLAQVVAPAAMPTKVAVKAAPKAGGCCMQQAIANKATQPTGPVANQTAATTVGQGCCADQAAKHTAAGDACCADKAKVAATPGQAAPMANLPAGPARTGAVKAMPSAGCDGKQCGGDECNAGACADKAQAAAAPKGDCCAGKAQVVQTAGKAAPVANMLPVATKAQPSLDCAGKTCGGDECNAGECADKAVATKPAQGSCCADKGQVVQTPGKAAPVANVPTGNVPTGNAPAANATGAVKAQPKACCGGNGSCGDAKVKQAAETGTATPAANLPAKGFKVPAAGAKSDCGGASKGDCGSKTPRGQGQKISG